MGGFHSNWPERPTDKLFCVVWLSTGVLAPFSESGVCVSPGSNSSSLCVSLFLFLYDMIVVPRHRRVGHDNEGDTVGRWFFLQDRRCQDVDHQRNGGRPHHGRCFPRVRQNRPGSTGHQHVPRGEGEKQAALTLVWLAAMYHFEQYVVGLKCGHHTYAVVLAATPAQQCSG